MSQLISIPDSPKSSGKASKEEKSRPAWKNLVTCMNELYTRHNPLIGREHIDCQFDTSLFRSMGGRYIPYEEYI